ncbi:hypothetical protein FOA52_006058 [Chlamydomonas sp. UWO 241]|nr:hypothetical protein FOA52_006058 [Chlamydomonas sp. UWO 241]
MAPPPIKVDLALDRGLQDAEFQSWRLGKSSGAERSTVVLPGAGVATASNEAIDYVHTRAALMRNHLAQSGGRLFCFVAPSDGAAPGSLGVAEASVVASSSDGGEPGISMGLSLAMLAVLEPDATGASASVGARLDASLAAIDTSACGSGHPHPLAGALLVSRGTGDLTLLTPSPATAQAQQHLPQEQQQRQQQQQQFPLLRSPTVHPLRPHAPLLGHRPLSIETAYVVSSSGELRCVAWAVKAGGGAAAAPGGAGGRARRDRATVETFVITLRAVPTQAPPPPPAADAADAADASSPMQTDAFAAASAPAAASSSGSSGSRLSLDVVSVRLLRSSALPPHVALCHAHHDAVLLGLDPDAACAGGDGDVAGGSGSGHGAAAAAAGNRAGGGGGGGADVHIDCTRGGAGIGGAGIGGAGIGGGGGAAPMDEDDGDMDPRTLAQAAAALAKFTSDEVEAATDRHQWTDIYKESGPDGVGAMGGEPSLDLVLLPAAPLHPDAPATPGGGGGTSESQAASVMPRAEWHLACGAARILSAECAGASPGLLALSDDVDAAVVSVSWGAASGRVPSVRHEAYVPALAYVAAGTRRTCLHWPTSLLARLYYVYHATAPGDSNGTQEVVDMELDHQGGESVLGARLLQGAELAGGGASGAGAAALLLLTQRRLLLHVLRPSA